MGSMSETPRVEVIPIEEGATTDPNNINKHTLRGRALVENSLQRRGAFRSIASAGKGVETPVVYAGNLTLQTAVEAGFKEYIKGSFLGGVSRLTGLFARPSVQPLRGKIYKRKQDFRARSPLRVFDIRGLA